MAALMLQVVHVITVIRHNVISYRITAVFNQERTQGTLNVLMRRPRGNLELTWDVNWLPEYRVMVAIRYGAWFLQIECVNIR